MARLSIHLWENHRPGQVGIANAAPQFAVDEIANPAGGQAQRHQRRNEVGNVQPAALRLAGEQPHRRQDTEKAAVKRHAAFPDGKDLQGMRKIVTGFVEQHLPQASAKNYAEHAVEQQVVELRHRPAGF